MAASATPDLGDHARRRYEWRLRVDETAGEVDHRRVASLERDERTRIEHDASFAQAARPRFAAFFKRWNIASARRTAAPRGFTSR